MEAASGGYESVGRVLLERGADVNAPPMPTTKDTALTIAAEKGHLKFVQLLIEYGAQLDAKNKKGSTALWLACHNGHLEVVQTLVMNMADPDTTDSRRISCLMIAFRKGHIKICKYLVRHVRHFPSDQDCKRFISTLIADSSVTTNAVTQTPQQTQPQQNQPTVDKDLLKRCQQCMEIIFQAKDKQAQEANRVANNLLKELDEEKSREQNKKAAAQRKREKRKLKKKQLKDEKKPDEKSEPIELKEQSESAEIETVEITQQTQIENEKQVYTKIKLMNISMQILKLFPPELVSVPYPNQILETNFSKNTRQKLKVKLYSVRARLTL